MFRPIWSLLAIALLLSPHRAPAQTLEAAIRAHAPKVVDELSTLLPKTGTATVGFLKFRIEKDGKLSDSFGTLNLGLARRVERAVILELAGRDVAPFRVARDASSVAATIPGASHLAPEGKAEEVSKCQADLFTKEYPVAWGDATDIPAALVSGRAVFSEDRKFIQIRLMVLVRGEPLRSLCGWIQADTDASNLIEAGESVSLRRGVARPSGLNKAPSADPETPAQKQSDVLPTTRDAVHASIEQMQDPTTRAEVRKSSPVSLEIFYDGKLVEIEPKGGVDFVSQPQEGQKVELVLTRTDNSHDEAYGVVLKVNGINTIEKQTLAAEECRKWILAKGCAPVKVEGYLVPKASPAMGHDVDPFKVSSEAESAANEMKYGDQVGQISVTIFRENLKRIQVPPKSVAAQKSAQTDKSVTGDPPPLGKSTLNDLATDMQASAKKKGLIEPSGLLKEASVEVVKFHEPGLVESHTITYRPKFPTK